MKPKVLIADDETLIADTLALILNQGGFDARAVYSCRKALDIAPSFRPDILVSDVLMDINGVDAAVQLRTLLPNLRVFLLSGQSATADILTRSQAQNLRFEVLLKPVHPRELLRKLHDAAVDIRSVA
jgi:DNA-binding response OmpR family regulator